MIKLDDNIIEILDKVYLKYPHITKILEEYDFNLIIFKISCLELVLI